MGKIDLSKANQQTLLELQIVMVVVRVVLTVAVGLAELPRPGPHLGGLDYFSLFTSYIY